MKYKTQETEEVKQNSPLLEDIVDLIAILKEFSYALDCYRNAKNCSKLAEYSCDLACYWRTLTKLAVCLDSEHKQPTIEVTLTPTDSIKDLKDYEEKFYNMLKEIAENALEEKEIEVLAYLFYIIKEFKHYFCTLDESNISRETSSQ